MAHAQTNIHIVTRFLHLPNIASTRLDQWFIFILEHQLCTQKSQGCACAACDSLNHSASVISVVCARMLSASLDKKSLPSYGMKLNGGLACRFRISRVISRRVVPQTLNAHKYVSCMCAYSMWRCVELLVDSLACVYQATWERVAFQPSRNSQEQLSVNHICLPKGSLAFWKFNRKILNQLTYWNAACRNDQF